MIVYWGPREGLWVVLPRPAHGSLFDDHEAHQRHAQYPPQASEFSTTNHHSDP